MAEEEIINIAALVDKNLASLPSSTSRPCIYKIPPHLLEVNEKAYLPKLVSIGPIHCEKPYLQATQELKLQHLQCFLNATSHLCSLKDYLRILRNNEGKARSCYAQTVSLSTNDFILMLLIDAVFLLNYILADHEEVSWYSTAHYHLIKGQKGILAAVARDISLEENQIPFFILQMIYDMSFGAIHTTLTFTDLACGFVSDMVKINGERVKGEPNIEHLVDVMRIGLQPSITDKERSEYSKLRSSATHLEAVGVKFKASESKNLLDITFNDGVLWIPKFRVEDATESIYRSILAYENCHHYFDSYFVDYTSFLDKLTKTPEDVGILVRCGIVENLLGSEDDVAHLFNNITHGNLLNSSKYYYSDISKRLNEHASARFNKWKAILKRDYFGHPWAIISLIYALILLILTLLQTIGTFTQH